jgi:hypothetical protein
MIIEEEDTPSKVKPIILTVLAIILAFSLYKMLGFGGAASQQEEAAEESIQSIEAFWKPTKDLINRINLDAETHIAINKLEPGEIISAEMFRKGGNQILEKIDGPEEQVITWKGVTDEATPNNIIGRLYLSGWTPKEGESFAYGTVEVYGPDNSLKMERIYPIDESSTSKAQRIKQIEKGEQLPPPEFK